MTKRKKKPLADLGAVLRKIKEPATLQPWADFIATIEPWKSLEISAERMMSRWSETASGWQFYTAADAKHAKTPGFENEQGLIVFALENTRATIEGFLKAPLPAGLEDGGYIATVATKLRQKGIGKYLLSAAERVVSEKYPRMFLFVSESNAAAQRFYKSAGYEEVGRAVDCIKPGNTELLFTKKLV